MNILLSSIILRESITHLEDLPLKEFIQTVETLGNKIVTEKLDGANLWMGLDEVGVFTSREGKSPKKGRFYDVDDYPMVANYNAFRAAHLAIEKNEAIIRKHLKENDILEIEVLFGRQPNTVTYGVSDKNFMVILRAVNNTPQERVDALAKALENKSVAVETTIVSSPDGTTLEQNDERLVWEFTSVKPINPKSIDTSEALELLGELKKFLKLKNEWLNIPNEEVAGLSMTSIPKEKREATKKERDAVNAKIMDEFKVPIKELLLNKFVRKIKPFLQDKDLHPSEDIGVEGVVVRDPVTGSMTKIVDKDVFTAINTFNSAVRSHVSGLVRTTDQDAAVEMRGGAFGQAKIRIAELLGAKELAMSSGTKRFVTKFLQNDAYSTAKAVADSLGINNVPGIRIKISAILKNTVQEVDEILDGFKEDAGEFTLKLKTGKEIGLSPEVMKRTLTAFAETKADIADVNSKILKSKTATDLVMALYGRTIESLFTGGEQDVKEAFAFIKSLNEDEVMPGAESTPISNSPTVGSTNIAVLPTKLFKGRKVQMRTRTFQKTNRFAKPKVTSEQHFPFLKSMTEEWAHVDDMKFATDVTDSAKAKNDIEFNMLRNNVNLSGDLAQVDVKRYLDKAHELNDEVETVTFGLEMDTGDIIKVYVNATQADGFETAMAELLGSEDDPEQVINTLADTFDIVDVQWPEPKKVEVEEPVDDFQTDEEPPIEDESSEGGMPSAEDEEPPIEDESSEDDFGDMDLSTSSDEAPADDADGETTDTESSDSEDDFGDMDLSTSSDEAPADDADEDSTTDDLEDEDDLSDEDSEDADDTEEDFEDELNLTPSQKPKKKKAKDAQPKEESMKTYGEQFRDKLLAESKKRSDEADVQEKEDAAIVLAREKMSAQVDKLLAGFPSKQSKAIVTLMVALGVPVKAMMQRKSDLLKSTDAAAEMFISNSSFRLWVKKLLTALNEQTVTEAMDVDVVSKRMTNRYQHLIFNVLKGLGLTSSIEAVAQRALVSGIFNIAKIVQTSNPIRKYLLAIADELGVDKATDKPEPPPLSGLAEQSTLQKTRAVSESIEDSTAAINSFLAALGLDVEKNRSISMQQKQPETRAMLNKLAAHPNILKKMQFVGDMIQNLSKTPGQQSNSASAPTGKPNGQPPVTPGSAFN